MYRAGAAEDGLVRSVPLVRSRTEWAIHAAVVLRDGEGESSTQATMSRWSVCVPGSPTLSAYFLPRKLLIADEIANYG